MQRQLFLSAATWAKTRLDYTEEEKTKLNAAISGEAICPSGCFLDEEELGTELAEKVRNSSRSQKCVFQQ
jgi:hypothetical protein